ncbi:MAG: hypothetical protein SNJ73_07220, partial [Acetobacteraceae bacterium]
MIHDLTLGAVAPLALVVGALLVAAETRSDRAVRLLLPLFALGVVARYLAWRLGFTLDGPGIDTADRVFIAAFLFVELLGLFDGLVLMLILSRRRDNRPLADRHESRLRAADPRELPAVD